MRNYLLKFFFCFISDDKGIKSRIELAMDLVKSHLTSAVNQEIVFLKNQIKKLNEKCNRLEQDNQVLKKHALPETIALLENSRGGGVISSNQSASNSSGSNQSIMTNGQLNSNSKLPR